MKKLLALLLVLVMALSLAACAAKTETADAPAEDPASTETAPAEETPEAEETAEPVVEEQPVETAELVELTVFAAASLTEFLTAIGEKYMSVFSSVSASALTAFIWRSASSRHCCFVTMVTSEILLRLSRMIGGSCVAAETANDGFIAGQLHVPVRQHIHDPNQRIEPVSTCSRDQKQLGRRSNLSFWASK